ncbi:MAG TPA: gamma-glutamyltransferase [Chloroflexia bacterium]|nr:gamma-glutamyltransferase [Chloroflexia bacterium]
MDQTRQVTMARHGLVSAPHYLASQAGVRIMMAGGNAVDAAIAANAVLNVVYPFVCGTGGDLFMLLYDAKTDTLQGLNASGRAPAAATPEWFQANGYKKIPQRGILSVSIPGAVDGWQMASERYGRLGLARCLEPAITYAEEGFGVGYTLSASIKAVMALPDIHSSWLDVYAPGGKAPEPGDILKVPELGRSLRLIAEQGRDVFYKGEIAKAFAAFSESLGGLITEEDLAEHHGEWVDPLSIDYRGYRIYELPPNTHGLTALQMIKLLEGFNLSQDPFDPANIHLQVEAKKLAFADRDYYITDAQHMKLEAAHLLNENYLAKRRKLIDPQRAMETIAPGKVDGDTIYLCAADGDGNAVSLIQSNYMGIGSGLVVPGYGIELQNRGCYFSLDPNHANVIAPRKRTMHTLIPSMAFRNDRPAIVFGTMGGDGQPQIHQQVYNNLIDYGLNIQAAIDAPRWIHGRGFPDEPYERLFMEGRFPKATQERLAQMGHAVSETMNFNRTMGYAQGIVINQQNGLLMGGADPRADSAAIGW